MIHHTYSNKRLLITVSRGIALVLCLLSFSLQAEPASAEQQFMDDLKAGNCDAIQTLLEQQQLDPNTTISDISLLSYAAGNGDLCVMQALLAAGAEINDPDDSGMPVTNAFMGGRYAAVKYLVHQGAVIPDLLKNTAVLEKSRAIHWRSKPWGLM